MSNVIYGALWNFIPLGRLRKPFYWVFSIPYSARIRRAMHTFITSIIEERIAQKDSPKFKRHLETIELLVEMPTISLKEAHSFRHSIRMLHSDNGLHLISDEVYTFSVYGRNIQRISKLVSTLSM